MDLQKLKTLNDSLLRGGFCALWLGAFILTIYEFLFYAVADSDSPEQHTFLIHAAVCGAIGIAATAVHAFLIQQALHDQNN